MVKVEMQRDEEKGIISLAFESSTSEELDVLKSFK